MSILWTACCCKLNNQSSGCRPKCCITNQMFFFTIILFMIDHRYCFWVLEYSIAVAHGPKAQEEHKIEQTYTINAHRWYCPQETNQCAHSSYLSCDRAPNCFTPGIMYWIDMHTVLRWEKINVEAFFTWVANWKVCVEEANTKLHNNPPLLFFCMLPLLKH